MMLISRCVSSEWRHTVPRAFEPRRPDVPSKLPYCLSKNYRGVVIPERALFVKASAPRRGARFWKAPALSTLTADARSRQGWVKAGRSRRREALRSRRREGAC